MKSAHHIRVLAGIIALITTATHSSPAADSAATHAFNVTASYATGPPSAGTPTVITDSDLQCLSELPVEKLLRIRKTLRYVSHMLDAGGAKSGPALQQHSYPAETVHAMVGQRRNGPAAVPEPVAATRGRYVGADGYTFEGAHRADGAQAAALMMDQIK